MHATWYLGNSNAMFERPFNWGLVGIGLVPLLLWSLCWKGLALWHAAKRGDTLWFIILLILNTAGIVEIGYLVFVVRLFDKKVESPKPSTPPPRPLASKKRRR